MLNRYEEAKSARTIVTNLSSEGLATLECWLRGRAASATCSCGAGLRRRQSSGYWPLRACPADVSFDGYGQGAIRR